VFPIEAHGLCKSFDGVQAVAGIDLTVDEHDVVALLGPNGAGKTTTLMMLIGATEPDAGHVRLLGHVLPKGRTTAMRDVAFAASYLSVPGDLRVRQFLDLFADIYGVPRHRSREVAERFGVDHLLERRGTQLSSGQRTVVGLVRALVPHPRLLILDEPTASLDPEAAVRVRDLLSEAQAEERFTILITSHNMREVERLCRRVVFLAHGRIVADGSPADVNIRYGSDDLESTFLEVAREARR
jgi:ABC-2 type transport system ATP-binding protein